MGAPNAVAEGVSHVWMKTEEQETVTDIESKGMSALYFQDLNKYP